MATIYQQSHQARSGVIRARANELVNQVVSGCLTVAAARETLFREHGKSAMDALYRAADRQGFVLF